jgi:hypothetical protein
VQGPWVAEHWLLWMAALSRDNNSADEFVAISRKYISTVHRANGCDSSMLSAPTWPQSRECVIEPSSLRWVDYCRKRLLGISEQQMTQK